MSCTLLGKGNKILIACDFSHPAQGPGPAGMCEQSVAFLGRRARKPWKGVVKSFRHTGVHVVLSSGESREAAPFDRWGPMTLERNMSHPCPQK